MGYYDRAKICELTGSYLLNQLANIIDKESIGLYRNDGLGFLQNITGPKTDHLRKSIMKLFKNCGLGIAVQTNLQIMNLLDDQFYVDTKTYQPCRKPDSTPMANRLLALLNVIPTSKKTVKKSDHLIHNFQSRYFHNYHNYQNRLYVIIMSCTLFRVNLHSIVA